MGSLQDPVTYYKIAYAGEQVAQWDNATRTIPPGPASVLEVPPRSLVNNICDFVPCDCIVQRAHLKTQQSPVVLEFCLRGLKAVSSTQILMGRYNYS